MSSQRDSCRASEPPASPERSEGHIEVVAAVIERAGRVLIARRQVGSHLGGLWEFPGGKRQAGETAEAALVREIREELDAAIDVGELVFHVTHAYDDRTVALYFYRCRLRSEARPLLGQEMRWVPRAELPTLGFPPADEELIRLLTGSGVQ